MDQTREIIVRLLNSIGSRREVEQYLSRFSSAEKRMFAVVKAGGGLLQDSMDELASALTFLQRVGLMPIVIHGAGPQLNAALAEAGIATRTIDGMRVTDAATLDIARKVFQRENLRLVDALEAMGTRARPVPTGVFQARFLDREKYGFVGEVEKVNLDPLRNAVNAGHLPILTCLGETESGQIVNINADVAARELALEVEPFKIVFLTDTGGLLDQHGRVISSINLSEDYDHLMEQEWVHSGMRLKLQQVKQLLDELPLSSSVSITSAVNLPRELFTHRGAGTLIQRGERVLEFNSWEGVDRGRFGALIEEGFGRRLSPGYFESKDVLRIYATEQYRATAVITNDGPVPYLDKYAVTPKAQGEGLGASVWNRMRADFPQLFWRSRVENPVNTWYFQQADGTYKEGPWTVFWYGVTDYDQMRACVEKALAMPATLELKESA